MINDRRSTFGLVSAARTPSSRRTCSALMTAWSGDMVAGWGYAPPYTQGTPENIGYWFLPIDEGPVDNDLIAIPQSAEHPALGHEFINFFLDQHWRWTTSPGTGTSRRRTRPTPTRDATEGCTRRSTTWAAPAMYVLPGSPSRSCGRRTSRRAIRRAAVAGGRRPLARCLGGIHRRWLAEPSAHHPAFDPPGAPRRDRGEGVHYPRWFWPSFSLPAILWLADPVRPARSTRWCRSRSGPWTRSSEAPLPVYQPWYWSYRAVRRDPRQGLRRRSSARSTSTRSSTCRRKRDLPGPRLRGRLLRRSLRRQAEGAAARAADLAVLDQLPDADARLDQPPRERRVRERSSSYS